MSTKPSAQIPASLPPVFTYSDAIAVGLSADRLYHYRDEGLLEQLGRGLYRRANASPADHNLLEIAHRAPEGTMCLTTALARHGLTDVIPDRIDISVNEFFPSLRNNSLGSSEKSVIAKASIPLFR